MSEPLRLLIVDDVQEDAELIVEELSRAYDVNHLRVDTRGALRDALGGEAWDLLITDFALPQLTGLDVLHALGATRLDLPCIVISGTIDEEAAVEAFRAGARDFISKNRLARLLPAVSRELGEAAERRETRQATQALAEAGERMRFALQTAGVGTWEADLATGNSAWSGGQPRRSGGLKRPPLHVSHLMRRASVRIPLDKLDKSRRNLGFSSLAR